MATLKADPGFKYRFIVRSTILLVPPLLVAAAFWRGWIPSDAALPAGVFFVAWIAAWIVLDLVLFRSYRCPSCGQSIPAPTIPSRVAGDLIRYHCPGCDIEWDTGLRESSE